MMTEIEGDYTWDDEALIKAYNKSVRLVDQRIEEIAGQNVLDGADIGEIKHLKRRIKKKDDSQELLWKVGDHCIAVYKEDGLEYEAKIISIEHKYGCCVVKYLGYDNEECQYLQDLRPTRGPQSQADQIQHCHVNAELEDDDLDRGIQNVDAGSKFAPETPQEDRQPHQETRAEFILPPPPTFLTNNLTEPLSKENEALASMLMSWYMCGYQTGYYFAIKQMNAKE